MNLVTAVARHPGLLGSAREKPQEAAAEGDVGGFLIASIGHSRVAAPQARLRPGFLLGASGM